MDEEETRAIAREEILRALRQMEESVDWYMSGYGDLTESAARLVKDVAERTADALAPAPDEEPEPVNPFALKRTPQQWADSIRSLIQEAEADGYFVWIDHDLTDEEIGLKIGTKTSEADNDPVIWSDRG